MILAAESLTPALSGALGAIVGAGASVLGQIINARHQEKKQRADRLIALQDRESAIRLQATEKAATVLSQAFSLLHTIVAVEAAPDDLKRSTETEQVRQLWVQVRDQLFIVGATYPEQKTAEGAISLVGDLTDVMRRLSAPPQAKEGLKSPYVVLEKVIEVLNRVRRDQKREPLLFEEQDASIAEVS
jgi:hypothetical protein